MFAARNRAPANNKVMSMAMVFAVMVSALGGVLAFWAAGGHALLQTDSVSQKPSRVSAPLAQMASPVEALPDPVVTSSVPVNKPNASDAGFTAPLPRPARIERAGSILMIRPAGD